MSESYERLAAIRPANTNEADLYALTSGEFIGAVYVCNQDSSTQTFRVAITDTAAGVAANGEDFIEYDTEIPANTTFRITILGIKAISTIRIKAGIANLISFSLMGLHKT